MYLADIVRGHDAPNTQKRGNTYFFRRKVPADLHAHYTRKVLLVSLGTSDYETAKVRAAEMTAKTNRELAELRGHKADEWKAPARLAAHALSVADAFAHADEWEQEYRANRKHHKAVRRFRVFGLTVAHYLAHGWRELRPLAP